MCVMLDLLEKDILQIPVVLKMTASPKPFPTNFARKWFLFSMNVLVVDQVVSPAEFLSTDLTPVQQYGENG